MQNYLKNINEITVQNGLKFYEEKQFSVSSIDTEGPIYNIIGTCNGFQCKVEFTEQKIFQTKCECILGRNGIICQHAVTFIFAYNNDYRKNSDSITTHVCQITKNKNIADLITNLIIMKNYIVVDINHSKLFIYFVNAQLANQVLENYAEIIHVLTNNKENLLYDFDGLIKICEFIKQYHKTENTEFDLKQLHTVLTKYGHLATLKLNHVEYKCPIMHDGQKNVDIHIAKSPSLGYILNSNIQDGAKFVQDDDVYFFLVYSDCIKWFVSVWNNYDNLNLIFKLDTKFKNEVALNTRIEEITNSKLFNATIHGYVKSENNDITHVIFDYDSDKRKCYLQFNGFKGENLIKKYFYNFNFKENKNRLESNDKKTISHWFSILRTIETYHQYKVSVNPIFHVQEYEDCLFKFEVREDKIHCFISHPKWSNEVLDNIFEKVNTNNFVYQSEDELINLDAEIFKKLKQKILQLFNHKQMPLKTHYVFNNNQIFFLNNKFESSDLKNFTVDFYDKINHHNYVQDDLIKGLKPYQVKGINWMIGILELTHGCLLADEMGLGKTIQAIGMIKYFYQKSDQLPTLIIVPLSLMGNWVNEFRKFFPEQKVTQIYGTPNVRKNFINSIANGQVYITTYNLIANDIDLYLDYNFLNVILDEGQYIKNSKVDWTKQIKKLHATNKLILSGTPIENNLLELWSIFDFIMPKYLPGIREFKRLYVHKRNKSEISSNSTSNTALYELSLKIKPFFLQRKKTDHLDLPEKDFNKIYIDMSKDEQKEYNKLLTSVQHVVRNSTDNDGNILQQRIEILALITKLRQFCCCPSLLNIECATNSKLKKTIELITSILEKDPTAKIVLFSNFSSMLKLIYCELIEIGYETLIMIGEHKSFERETILSSFNQSKHNILLVSLKVGGVGLNLTVANHVIHYNPWWNESAELQAIDRLHRIGQNKQVFIYQLIYNWSIEKDIESLKTHKTNIINKTLNDIKYSDLLKLIREKVISE